MKKIRIGIELNHVIRNINKQIVKYYQQDYGHPHNARLIAVVSVSDGDITETAAADNTGHGRIT